MKKLFLTAILLVAYLIGESQQDPIYAQYLNNPVLLNPAYTGINIDLMLWWVIGGNGQASMVIPP